MRDFPNRNERAIIRSRAISFQIYSARSQTVARISGANMIGTNATRIPDMIAMPDIRCGPLITTWTMTRAFAIGA